jgi:hypothetical protein
MVKSPRIVVVNGERFAFGTGQRNSAMEHTFVLRNDGNAPLSLRAGATSCKCTLSELAANELAPGQSGDVKLEWTLKSETTKFFQTAEIMTNDSSRPVVVLSVSGSVVDLVRVDPTELVLSGISSSEPASTSFRLYGYVNEDLSVVEHTFANPETAAFFDVTFEDLPPDVVEIEAGAKCGLLATVAVKPGLPLGPINQTIQLVTNIEKAPSLEVALAGSVVSDISIVGAANFKSERNLLDLGVFPSSEGVKKTLRVLIKGPYRHDIQPDIKSVDPLEVLSVTRGEARKLNNGAVYMYPLYVEVAAGAQPTNRLGSDQGKLGKIVLETDHPDARTINIYVKFAIK